MNKKLNKKGFTLIELLAVIVILAILVMIAIPAVTKYLTTSRQGAFADNAQRAIEAVRNDIVTTGFSAGSNSSHCSGTTCTYNKADIDDLLDKKLNKSPFGGNYSCARVTVTQSGSATNPVYAYSIVMIDASGNGIGTLDGNTAKSVAENSIKSEDVIIDGSLKDKCPA